MLRQSRCNSASIHEHCELWTRDQSRVLCLAKSSSETEPASIRKLPPVPACLLPEHGRWNQRRTRGRHGTCPYPLAEANQATAKVPNKCLSRLTFFASAHQNIAYRNCLQNIMTPRHLYSQQVHLDLGKGAAHFKCVGKPLRP